MPSLDRIVVGLTFMGFPGWSPARASIEHDHRGNQVQVWRLSTLTLVKTIKLAEPEAPNEPRLLRDGKTVLVNTATCRLFRVAGLETTNPSLELVSTRVHTRLSDSGGRRELLDTGKRRRSKGLCFGSHRLESSS